MQYLKKLMPLVATAAMSVFGAGSALADGTDANTTVTNNASLSFDVNGITQNASTTVAFLVDRKLAIVVATQNSDYVTAVPGQSATPGSVNELDFLVTNTSNDTSDVVIALVDRSATAVTGFSAQVGTPPGAFAPTPPTGVVWDDRNNDGVIDAGEPSAALDPSGTTQLDLDDLVENASTNIKVIVSVDAGAAADLYRTFTLVAAVADTGTALTGDDSGNAAPGGSSTDVANGQNTIETVFADGDSTAAEDVQFDFVNGNLLATLDADSDGQSADSSGFITAVALAIAKYVEVLFDPISGNAYDGTGVRNTANPKNIPGAVLLYVVGVVNANATISADSVIVNDDIPNPEVLAGDEANPTGLTPPLPAVDLPSAVTFDVGGSATTFNLDRTNIITDLDAVWVQGCQDANASDQAFDTADPEVASADLGTCDAGEQGYVAYLVTINDAP